jgi:hypothetical protein
MVERHRFHLKQHAFFRSEERVRERCAAHDYPMRPLVTMGQRFDHVAGFIENQSLRDATVIRHHRFNANDSVEIDRRRRA